MTFETTPIAAFLRAAGLATALSLVGCGADTPKSLIASGKEYVAKKDNKAAVVQFKAALQLDPQSAEARALLGQALLASGDPAGAVLELSKALDQKADANLVLPALGRALLLVGDYKKLATVYGEINLDDKPAQAALKVAVATAWGTLNDRAKTESNIAAALAAVPDYGPAVLLNARVAAGKRDFDTALVLVDKILARDPSLYEAWLLKGELLAYAKNDDKGGEAAFRKSIEVEKAYVPGHLAIISMHLRQRDLPGAKAQAEQLRAVLPKHPQTLYVDAQIAFAERDMAKARDLTQQLLKMTTGSVGVLQLAGAIDAQMGSLVQAETHFAKALQISPDLPLARRSLARVYLRLSQPVKALETLQPLLQGDAGGAEALAIAGEAQLRLGDISAAEGYFVRAAKISPEDTRVRTAVALTKLSRGDVSAAFNELEALTAKSTDLYTEQAIITARIKRREFDAALATVEAMDKKQPNVAAVADLRGRVQLLRKDYPAARAAYEQALKLDPALFSATASLAAIDLIERKPAQAQQRLEATIKADPRNHYALMALAEMKVKTNAPLDEVKGLLNSAIKAAPNEPVPRLQLIELLLKKRLFKEALTAAQDAIAAMPNDLNVLDTAGRAQMEAGDVEQAIATFRKLAGTEGNGAGAYLRLADVYKASGRRPQAESALRKALELNPDMTAAQTGLVDLLVGANRQRDALDFAAKVQKERPGSSAGWLLEALVHSKSKAPDAALASLKAGLARNKDASDIARELYKMLLDQRRNDEADRFGAAWMKDHPRDLAFDYVLAMTNILRGEVAMAETRLQRIVAQRPNNALSLNNLAWVLVVQGKPGAVAHAQRAVELMPDRPVLLDTLAMALAAEKKFPEAMSAQKRALELAPNDNALHFNLAKIAAQSGDKELARQELTKLQELGPAFNLQAEVGKLLKTL